jgi:pimeloyl-ACP methyl ester carboxylesterase
VSIPVLQKTLLEGKTVAWREAGDGDALVLLHGIGGNSESWKEQLNKLCDRYRVIAWDMPGYGGSDGFGSFTPNVDAYSDTLAALLNFLDVKKAHILGQSIAALVAARFCVRNPDRIKSYLFAHGLTGLGSLEEEAREKAKRGRIEIFEALGPKRFAREKGPAIMSPDVSEEAREVAVGIMANVNPAGFRQAVEMLSTANLFEDTALIQVPSLVLCGADDPIAPENICRSVVAALPDAQFCLIPGVGHYSATEDPAKFNQAVLSFLDKVDFS